MTTYRFRVLVLSAVALSAGCGRSDESSRDGPSPTKVYATPAHHAQAPEAPPLAAEAMKKAVVPEQRNPDAWRSAYLDKRYHVIGKVASITGSTQSDAGMGMFSYSGQVFRISLEPWNLPSSKFPFDLMGPDLSFIDLPRSERLKMRPGQQIDADCTLTSNRLTFGYCKLNQTPR